MTDDRPKRLILNATTGEEIIEYLTDEEIAEMQVLREQFEVQRAAEQAEAQAVAALKAAARAKLVAGQPLTEEEAATLVI